MTMPFDDVRAEVEGLLRHYGDKLRLPGYAIAYAEAIAQAAWNVFPRGGKFHDLRIFAEVIAFHAMKAAGLLFDQAAFRAASLLEDAPVSHRWWLLEYQKHLPPALRVVYREPGPEAWFARMQPGPLVDAARAVSDAEGARLTSMRPRIRAAACVAVARKRIGRNPYDGPSASETLAAAGISMATAYNAAVRAGLIEPPRKVARIASAAAVA